MDSVMMKMCVKYTKHVCVSCYNLWKDIWIFPFADVTEDVRVNKKLEMSLNSHLASS